MIDLVTTRLIDWLSVGILHGTVLALLTALAAVTVLRRARPALHAALWAIVLVKFLVPVGPGAEFSLSTAVERVVGAAPPAVAGAADLPPGAVSGTPAAAAPDLFLLLAYLAYLAGLGWIAARRLARGRTLRRAVHRLAAAPAAAAAGVAAMARGIRLTRLPELRIDPDAAGPYLVGRMRPVLVLPGWLDAATPAWSAAVAHELAHLRRRDPLLGALEGAVSLVFWFWPPVLWVRARLDRAREMACDQWALAHGPLAPREYARFLVDVAMRRARGASPEPSASFGLLRRRGQLIARVDHLLGGARPASLGRRPAAAAAAWAVLCLAGASRATSAAPAGSLICAIEPELVAQILASNPDADADRDGVLSQDEACAHQLRMKQRLIDQVVDAELVSRVDPAADVDGDGVFSPGELDLAKDQFDVGLSGAEDVVLEHEGGAALPLPGGAPRVAAAPAPASLCPADRCTDRPVRRKPLLIDVSRTTKE